MCFQSADHEIFTANTSIIKSQKIRSMVWDANMLMGWMNTQSNKRQLCHDKRDMFTATLRCIVWLLVPVFFGFLLGSSIIQINCVSAATGSLFILHCISRGIIYKCFIAVLLLQYTLSCVSVVTLQYCVLQPFQTVKDILDQVSQTPFRAKERETPWMDKEIQNELKKKEGQGCFFHNKLRSIQHPLSTGLVSAVGWMTPRDTLSPDSLFN